MVIQTSHSLVVWIYFPFQQEWATYHSCKMWGPQAFSRSPWHSKKLPLTLALKATGTETGSFRSCQAVELPESPQPRTERKALKSFCPHRSIGSFLVLCLLLYAIHRLNREISIRCLRNAPDVPIVLHIRSTSQHVQSTTENTLSSSLMNESLALTIKTLKIELISHKGHPL